MQPSKKAILQSCSTHQLLQLTSPGILAKELYIFKIPFSLILDELNGSGMFDVPCSTSQNILELFQLKDFVKT